MTVLAITFDGTRLNDSDANTGWGNYGSGGGAPSSEGANAYQISTGAAANTGVVGTAVKLTGAARDGIDYIPGASVDMTAAANRLWYVKAYITDSFDLQIAFGAEIAMGSADQSNYHEYVVAGTDAALPVYDTWPAQGGYLITCIDPTIDTWANVADSGGTFDQTAVNWFGFRAVFINGNSKSENLALDSIDYGTGLTLLSGTGADPAGKYTDYVEADQNDIDKRWGAAVGIGDAVTFRGIATVGASGTATEFDDSTSIVTFPDGYHSRGLFGVNMDIQNASSIIADGALLIGAGTRNGADANDTRPDYTVVGTSGAYTFTGVLRNFRDVEFTSVCDVNGEIECMLLTQASANIENATIKTNALTNVACLQDPTFGASTDLNNTDFVQTGAGHAIEALATATLNNIGFSGYGGTPGSNLVAASGAADAAIFNDTGGAITLTISGGDTPSVRNGAGATTTIVAAITVTLTPLITGSVVSVYLAGTATQVDETLNSGTSFAFSVGVSTAVDIVIMEGATGDSDAASLPIRIENISFTAAQSVTINQLDAPNFVG